MCRDKQYKNAIGLLINYKYAGIIINIDNIKVCYPQHKKWSTAPDNLINIYLDYIAFPKEPKFESLNYNNNITIPNKSDDNPIILQLNTSPTYKIQITDNLSIIKT
jgi:hypothetical protein